MKRARTGRIESKATLNLTPTIDVVFLLLIFFVATMKLPVPEANIRAYLPRKEMVDATGQTTVEQKDAENVNKITIALRRGAGGTEMRLNGALIAGGFSRLDRKLRSLQAVARQAKDVRTVVTLDAGAEVPYRYVVTTLDVCAKNQFSDISFAMPLRGPTGSP